MSNSSSLSDVDEDLDGIYGIAEVEAKTELEVSDEPRGLDALIARMFEVEIESEKPKKTKRRKKTRMLQPQVPFHITGSIALVPLCVDLAFEPYTDQRSLPMCLLSTRPFFQFKTCGDGWIRSGTNECISMCDRKRLSGRKGPDMASYISVVDVYDFYGLEMAYSYMHHLYHAQVSIQNTHWMAVYIIGSISVVNSELAKSLDELRRKCGDSPLFVSHVCSVLLSELIVLDSKEPRLATPIEPHATVLPVEILARIFNSVLISKSIAEHVTKQRSCRVLRPGEFEARARHPRVMNAVVTLEERKGGVIVIFYIADVRGVRWELMRGSRAAHDPTLVFTLRKKARDVDYMDVFESHSVVLYSPRDYARFSAQTTQETFCRMLSEVDINNQDQLCAWIVMLAHELDDETFDVTVEASGLSRLFSDLKGEVLAKLESENA